MSGEDSWCEEVDPHALAYAECVGGPLDGDVVPSPTVGPLTVGLEMSVVQNGRRHTYWMTWVSGSLAFLYEREW